MATHPVKAVAELRDIGSGNGGKTAIVSALQSGAIFAGLHRQPASTLLESVLTFLAIDTYDEIILVAGRGSHLPRIEVGKLVTLGASRAIVYLRRRESTVTPSVLSSSTQGIERFLGNNRPANKRSSSPNRIELDAANMNWKDRLAPMFDRIERWCGVDHLGNRQPDLRSAADLRRLILIDAEFLMPDRAMWSTEFSREQSEAGHLPARFGRLPEIVTGTRNDLILLARDQQEATSLEAGTLIYRSLPEEARRFDQFNFKWENTPCLTMSAPHIGAAFQEYYPEPLSPAYAHFRTVGAVNPDMPRILPLERITADETYRRMREDVVGQDEALHVIADTITRNITNRAPTDTRPIACFLLVGPTGTGKTLTATALAKALFGRVEGHFHVIDGGGDLQMSPTPLLGLPPGYVGFTDDMQRNGGGHLTKPLIANPDKPAVIVIDELSRAHERTPDVLFMALDKGWARDGSSGHVVTFRNCIIVFATNFNNPTLEKQFIAMADDGASWDQLAREATGLLNQDNARTWSRAFLGRFRGCVLPLCDPRPEHLIEIAQKIVTGLIQQRHRVARISERFLAWACESYDRKLGIRNLEAKISGRLDDQLAAINRSGCPGLWLNVDDSGRIQEAEEIDGYVSAVGTST